MIKALTGNFKLHPSSGMAHTDREGDDISTSSAFNRWRGNNEERWHEWPDDIHANNNSDYLSRCAEVKHPTYNVFHSLPRFLPHAVLCAVVTPLFRPHCKCCIFIYLLSSRLGDVIHTSLDKEVGLHKWFKICICQALTRTNQRGLKSPS